MRGLPGRCPTSVEMANCRAPLMPMMLIGLIIAVLAGCGHVGSPGNSAPSGPGATSHRPSSSVHASSSPPRPGRRHACRTAQMRVMVVKGAEAGPAAGGYIGFVNDGKKACSLTGWPTLVAIMASGKSAVAGHARTTAFGRYSYKKRSVLLKSGTKALAAFEGGVFPADSRRACPLRYHLLRVTPPGNTRSVTISALLPYQHLYLPSCTRIVVTTVFPSSVVGTHG